MNWTTEPDRFGVPGNTFGAVPEDFYAAMGRIVNLGALVEQRLSLLVEKLAGLQEKDVAGEQMKDLAKRFDKIAKSRELPTKVLAAKEEAVQAMYDRNAHVHSLWPSPTAEDARGWRGIPKKQRTEDGPHLEWIFISDSGIRELILRLVRVVAALNDSTDSV